MPTQLSAARAAFASLSPTSRSHSAATQVNLFPGTTQLRLRRAPFTARRQSLIRAQATQITSSDLKQLETLIEKNSEDDAVTLAASLRDSGILRAYGTGSQVPKRSYTLEELRLNKIEPKNFLSPEDTTLNGIRNILQGSFLAGLSAGYFTNTLNVSELVQWGIIIAFLLTVDQIANAGGIEALIVDGAGRIISPTYGKRVALHESGHFLIAYLLGLLPKGYHLSSWDAFRAQRVLNVQAGTTFCDGAFQKEVASGKLSSSSLDVYSCVALAGVATEWLRFGRAEGGLADVQQLDRLLRALGFTQAKADDQVRWAVLNVVSILRRHEKVQDRLADAMSRGETVAECMAVIEKAMENNDNI
ncbi:hypothetical protein Ndes2437A_g05946 [Nannochloris sp. 'desiccata']